MTEQTKPTTLNDFIEQKEQELVAYEDKIRDIPEELKIEGRRGFLAGRLRECAEKTWDVATEAISEEMLEWEGVRAGDGEKGKKIWFGPTQPTNEKHL